MVKKKRRFAVVLAILFVTTSSVGSVGLAEEDVVVHKDAEGNVYKAIKDSTPETEPMTKEEWKEMLVQEVGEEGFAEIKQNMELTKHRGEIQTWLKSNKIVHGGIYVKDDGTTVVQLTEKNPNLEKELKTAVSRPDKVEVEYVKYSEEELKAERKKLKGKTDKFGIIGLGLNDEKNKFNIYIKQEGYDKYKEEILNLVNEDMVNWEILSNNTKFTELILLDPKAKHSKLK